MVELKASRQELEADELNRRFEIELCLTKETPLTALTEDQLLNRYLLGSIIKTLSTIFPSPKD